MECFLETFALYPRSAGVPQLPLRRHEAHTGECRSGRTSHSRGLVPQQPGGNNVENKSRELPHNLICDPQAIPSAPPPETRWEHMIDVHSQCTTSIAGGNIARIPCGGPSGRLLCQCLNAYPIQRDHDRHIGSGEWIVMFPDSRTPNHFPAGRGVAPQGVLPQTGTPLLRRRALGMG